MQEATIEQPLEMRSFEETAQEGHKKIVFRVTNPLQLKVMSTQLDQVYEISQRDRYAWIDGTLKAMLPGWVYRKKEQAVMEDKKGNSKKALELMDEVGQFLRREGIEVVHPEGRSLHTYIYKNKVPVAEYELRLETK